jgi:hypothetical protein
VAPRLSVTVTVKLGVPVAVGLPLMVRVAVVVPLPVRPAGSVVVVHVYGAVPPLDVIDTLYAVFTVAPGRGEGGPVMVGAVFTVKV